MTVTNEAAETNPLSFGGFRLITAELKPIKLSETERADFLATLRKINEPRSPVNIQAQIEKQRAVAVEAVFRVGGKAIGWHQPDVGTTFASGADGSARGNADDIEAALRRKYGARLTVERYAAGTGPSAGEINDEMFGPYTYQAEAPQERTGTGSSGTRIWVNTEMLNLPVDDAYRDVQVAGSKAHARIRDLLLAEGYPDPGMHFTFGLKGGEPALFGIRDTGGQWNSTPPTDEIGKTIMGFFAVRGQEASLARAAAL